MPFGLKALQRLVKKSFKTNFLRKIFLGLFCALYSVYATFAETKPKTAMSTQKFYTTKEVAALLRVNLATLQKHIREGRVKTCRPLGLTRISAAEVDRLTSESL